VWALSNDTIVSDWVILTTPNHPISITSRHCTKMAEQIWLIFGTEASLGSSCTVLEGNSGISRISLKGAVNLGGRSVC